MQKRTTIMLSAQPTAHARALVLVTSVHSSEHAILPALPGRSNDYEAAHMALLRSFQDSFCSFTVPCFVASGKCTDSSAISCRCVYSQLSPKRTPFGTEATVRFREVSALERVHVTWYPNLQTETRAFVQCTMIAWRTGGVSFSHPNGTRHSSYELVYFIKSRDVPVIRLRYFQVCYKFA